MASPINPDAQWPGDNMHPDLIEQAATNISNVGSSVSTTGGDVATAWSGLSKGYHAPEQETLLGAMKPATKAATDFGTDMGKVCTALTTFAGEVRTIKASVAKIRASARSFVAGIHDGKVTITQHVVQNRAQLEMGESTTESHDVDWNSDDATVQQNNSLIRQVNDQQEQLWAAERKCANAIRDIYGAPHIYAASQSNPNGYGVDQIPDNASNLPWGNTVDVKESCGDKVADGVFIDGLVNGLGGLIGFHYTQETATTPEGAGFSWSTLGHTWEGVAQLGTGIATGPVTPLLAGLPGPVGKWFNSSTETYEGFVPGLLGINVFNHDPNKKWYQDFSKDPFANWKNDPARTAGSVGFNVLTFAVPGPKGMGAFTKAGDAASVADKAGEVSDAGRAADGLGDLSKVTDAGGDLAKTAEPAGTTALGDLGKTTGDLGDGLDDLGKTDIDVPNAPHDNVNVDHPSVGDHSGDHGAGNAPEPRDPAHAGDGTGTTGHEPATTGHEPGSTGHEPGATGHDGTGHDGTGSNSPSTHGNPADHTPKTDPSVPKSDPAVAAEVKQIKDHIQPHLENAANDAWKHAEARANAEGISKPSAQRLGTYAHTYLDHWVQHHGNQLIDEHSGYRIVGEKSFDSSGAEVPKGTKGSIRPDLVLERINKDGNYDVVQAYDLKTGGAKITSAWENKVQTWLDPVYPTDTLRPQPVPAAPVGGGR